MKKIFFLLILLIAGNFAFGQLETKPLEELDFFVDTLIGVKHYGGNVTITSDIKLEKTITNYAIAYKHKPERVWRVQIYFGTGAKGRNKAQTIRTKFENKYPDIPTEIVFEEPYFKLRVGEYDNKFDADRLKHKIKDDFENTFIIEEIKDNSQN